jgi:hypothetical protein
LLYSTAIGRIGIEMVEGGVNSTAILDRKDSEKRGRDGSTCIGRKR